jgi:hypothetical protein
MDECWVMRGLAERERSLLAAGPRGRPTVHVRSWGAQISRALFLHQNKEEAHSRSKGRLRETCIILAGCQEFRLQ